MSDTISVGGTGSVAAAPDQAVVDVGVEVVGRTVAAARSAAATDMAAIVASLRDSGLEDGDLTTTAYTIKPEYDHRDGRRLRGFRVSNMVAARITDMGALGEIVDAATTGSEHVVVHGLRFAHQDETDLAARARQAAWQDAKAKAEQLASLAGVTLGPVASMTEHRTFRPGPQVRGMAMEAAMAPPIESGELVVSISIEVEFSIRD